MKNILHMYGRVIGQMINFYKSSSYFSRNVESSVKRVVSGVLSVSSQTMTHTWGSSDWSVVTKKQVVEFI